MGVTGSAVETRVDRALELSALGERADDRVDTLSGGMRRRINIVASLLHEPKVMMLDEPTVGIDVPARERIHELLRSLRASGLGILLSTHDLHQATALADRVVFLVGGRVRLDGAPGALIERVYGSGKELRLNLTHPPDSGVASRLIDLGLSPAQGATIWTGPVDEGRGGLAAWATALEDVGLEAAEIRLREPTLEGVFLRLTGDELTL